MSQVAFVAINSTKTYGPQKLVNRLFVKGESMNSSDRYAPAVLKDNVVVGHLPRQLSWILSLFMLRNGSIDCTVTEDIPQICHRED